MLSSFEKVFGGQARVKLDSGCNNLLQAGKRLRTEITSGVCGFRQGKTTKKINAKISQVGYEPEGNRLATKSEA